MFAGSLVGLALDRPECAINLPPADVCAEEGSSLVLAFEVTDNTGHTVHLRCAIFYRPPPFLVNLASNLAHANGYIAEAKEAVGECLSDGPSPLQVAAVAQCIWDSFDDADEWHTPRAALIFVLGDDPHDGVEAAVHSPAGGLMMVYQDFIVRFVQADGQRRLLRLGIYLMPPVLLWAD